MEVQIPAKALCFVTSIVGLGVFVNESFQSNLKYLFVDCRKDQIAKEADAAKRWAEKWEFLKTPLEEVKLNGIQYGL